MFILNPRLAADVFDDEYVIANLDSGLYYSIQGIAVSLIQALPFENPDSPIKTLGEALSESSEKIKLELDQVWKDLLQEEIVIEKSTEVLMSNTAWVPVASYTTPRFNKYADMQDLLMLDPIHDIDEEGWQVKKD